ncbi:MAG: carboxypeptidase M32 [Planctomycetes bacterium]|nr:carboxypeptidase M32 [Planctomycetota bacterium]
MQKPRKPEEMYTELVRWARDQTLLASCSELLSWDEETYMPRGGVAHRGNQLALIAGLLHERITSPRIGDLLAGLEASDLVRDPASPEAVNVRQIRRLYDRKTKVPRDLLQEIVRTTAFAQQEWGAAYHDADFARFRPWLEKLVTLRRKEAQCHAAGRPLYDALLDIYEAGACSADVTALFGALRPEVASLANEISAARRKPKAGIFRRDFPVDRQRVFGEAVATEVGFDFKRGRIDTTIHPFVASIGPGDCRIATRYAADNFGMGFFAILHEVGHALYEQGLDPEQYGTPMGEPASLGVHESQSRLWENTVGRSLAFWRHFFPLAREVFHETLHDVSLEDFHFAANAVAPGHNRSQADEVTYNLHVLVRFELESAMIAGDLAPADLPGAWNEACARCLGIVPPDDREGCLQDGHWGSGMFGYFPTYTLGNIYAAQLFAKASEEVGDLDGAFTRGEFAGLVEWLRDKVHRHGQRYRAGELIERATGAPPSHRPLIEQLRRKYGELYGL